MVLEALPAETLLAALEREHWTGRKGYSVRGMWSALIAGLLYECHSLARVVRLLIQNKDVRTICGFSKDTIPGEDAFGRFLKKPVTHEDLLEKCFADLVKRLRKLLPGFGDKLAVDSTDIKAYSDSHSKNPSDANARWGAKGAGHHGAPGNGADAESAGRERKVKGRDPYWWFGYPDTIGTPGRGCLV